MYGDEKKVKKMKKNNASDVFHNFFHKRTKRLLTKVDVLFTKIMWYQIALNAVLILFGIILLLFPEISVTVIGVLFGVIVLVFGGLHIYTSFKRNEISFFQFYFIYGIVGILLGILTFLNPFLFTQVMTIFIGIWLLYMAFIKGEFSLRLKKIQEKSWIILLVSSILEVFMSILIFINPFSNLLIAQVCGAYFILSGLIQCNDAILTKNRAIRFLENL